MANPNAAELKVVARQGSDFLLVPKDWVPGTENAIGFVVRQKTAYEYWVESLLARGYWEPASGDVASILSGVEVVELRLDPGIDVSLVGRTPV